MGERETAAERCEFCGMSIWADEDWELFVDSSGEADCLAAPMQINPAGSQYPMITGIHEAA